MDLELHACATCDTEVDEDRFCTGCGAFICEACDQVPALPWDHEIQDHQIGSLYENKGSLAQ